LSTNKVTLHSNIIPAPDLGGGERGAQAWWEAPSADTKCLGRG